MNLLDGTEIENASAKLKILKSLLSNVISDSDVLQIITEEIDNLEELENEGEDTTDDDRPPIGDSHGMGLGSHRSPSSDITLNIDDNEEPDIDIPTEEPNTDTLPTPADLGVGDLSNFDNVEI